MKCAAWRAFLGSFVLFLLSCGACDYGSREAHRLSEKLAAEGVYVCGGGGFPSEWGTLGAMLFIASVSVAGGGAMRWWRAEFVGEAGVWTPVLGLNNKEVAAGDAAANGETRDIAREEEPARPTPSLPPERAHPFEHFDALGRSRLEKILAGD